MKKVQVALLLVGSSFILCYCSFPKEAAKTINEAVRFKTTYSANVSQVITASCSPCHIPAKGGFKRPYDNYANVKADIDEIIRRIELSPNDIGFMPLKHAKLSDSAINVFKQWKNDGLKEL